MAVTGSPFCEHKKLRTSCPVCKAVALPPPTLAATPYVPTDERDAPAPRAARKPAEPKSPAAGGPGKPLMPKRRTKNRVTAEDEARAEAWWVKKG